MDDAAAPVIRVDARAGLLDRWRVPVLGEFALVAGVSLLLVAALALRTSLMTYGTHDFAMPWDHHKYIAMAQGNPLQFHIAPYCWRVVVPLVVKLLPGALEWRFFAVTFVSVWFSGVALYYIARRLGYSVTQAALGLLSFFALGIVTKGLLWDFWMSDPASLLVTMLVIWAILARQDALFVILLAVGAGVRESGVLAAPLYYTLTTRKFLDLRLLARTCLLVAPAAAVFFGLRHAIPALNGDPAYTKTLPRDLKVVYGGSHTDFSYSSIILWSLRHPFGALQMAAPAFGYVVRNVLMLWPFLLFFRRFELLLRFAPFLILIGLQEFFISDLRYLMGAYPVLILLALSGVGRLCDLLDLDPVVFAGLPVLFILLNLGWMGRVDAPGTWQVAALVAYLGAVLVGRFWVSPRPSYEPSAQA